MYRRRGFCYNVMQVIQCAEVAELAYACDSKSHGATPLVGSNPTLGTYSPHSRIRVE